MPRVIFSNCPNYHFILEQFSNITRSIYLKYPWIETVVLAIQISRQHCLDVLNTWNIFRYFTCTLNSVQRNAVNAFNKAMWKHS